jgi:hypothetical protein
VDQVDQAKESTKFLERSRVARSAFRPRMRTECGPNADQSTHADESPIMAKEKRAFFQRLDTELEVRRLSDSPFPLRQPCRSWLFGPCFPHDVAAVQCLSFGTTASDSRRRWTPDDRMVWASSFGHSCVGCVRLAGDHEVPARQRCCRGNSCPSTSMRTHMLACTSIIAQILGAQGNKIFFFTVMQACYAGCAVGRRDHRRLFGPHAGRGRATSALAGFDAPADTPLERIGVNRVWCGFQSLL